jgi:hypothetical protein
MPPAWSAGRLDDPRPLIKPPTICQSTTTHRASVCAAEQSVQTGVLRRW